MSKEEKPTLAGAQHKARKRNIAVPLDPGAFANEVIQTFEQAWKSSQSLEENLDAGVKVLLSLKLDFDTYGDTLFEVLFAGGRMSASASLAQDNTKKFDDHMFSVPPERDSVYPYIKVFQTVVRRRPALLKKLEATSVKLLKSLEFFDEEGRDKLAIATSLMFSPKIKLGILPENTLTVLLNDRLVQKGTVLKFVTAFFKCFLEEHTLDDLVNVLTKAKLSNRLLDFFPPQTRTNHDFVEHFTAQGMGSLVEWHRKKVVDLKINELKEGLTNKVDESPAVLEEYVKAQVEEGDLPEAEVLKVVWTVLMGSLNLTGKNQQQVTQAIIKQIRTHKKLISTYCSSARLEASLLVTVQVHCYQDSRLLKVFRDIVRILYDTEIVAEDTILYWYRKGSHQKGRNVFLKDIEPFIKWLEEAEEEDDDEEGEDDDEDDEEDNDEGK